MGEQVFACRIQTRTGDITSDDYRFDTPNLQHTVVECSELTCRLHAYMKAQSLNIGCFDFAVSRTGEIIFFERNCNGQRLWIQDRTGQPIGAAIAIELLQHSATHGVPAIVHEVNQASRRAAVGLSGFAPRLSSRPFGFDP